jgi:hypothetical protein
MKKDSTRLDFANAQIAEHDGLGAKKEKLMKMAGAELFT